LKHEISTWAWVVTFSFTLGFYAGLYVGNVTSPARHDARMIEQRLRMVFCEQAVRNKLMTTCEVD